MPTAVVLTVKFADVEPGGTVTLEGTIRTALLELDKVTTAPPDPAASVRVTVPTLDWPPAIVLGLIVSPLSAAGGGLTVKLTVLLVPE